MVFLVFKLTSVEEEETEEGQRCQTRLRNRKHPHMQQKTTSVRTLKFLFYGVIFFICSVCYYPQVKCFKLYL